MNEIERDINETYLRAAKGPSPGPGEINKWKYASFPWIRTPKCIFYRKAYSNCPNLQHCKDGATKQTETIGLRMNKNQNYTLVLK